MSQRLLDLEVSLFKDGEFDFISGDHIKQEQALQVLTDNTTKELTYGGAAGGAKSWTGCVWQAFMCLAYPGTKWFIGREELKRLRESTYITFHKVCKQHGIKQGEHFKYNGQDHYIQFKNSSRIDLLDCKYLPSDPLYERFGSLEYTGGWLEETGEIHFGAYDTLKTRCGRHMNDEYGLISKLLKTCNPKKNWQYTDEYKPFKEGKLPEHMKFIQSFVQDNPHIESGYIDNLIGIKDKVKRERLLHGNWEYDDDPSALIDFDSINDYFTNDHAQAGKGYITADIARMGADNTVIRRWNGWRVVNRIVIGRAGIDVPIMEIRNEATKNGIPMSRVIVDEDGVGGGVKDILKCKGFVNGSSAIPVKGEKENYDNLKSQCSYRMAARIVNKEIYEECTDMDVKQTVTEEMEQVKDKDPSGDKKKGVISRDKVIQNIGRSPDEWTSIMMREYFELKKSSIRAMA